MKRKVVIMIIILVALIIIGGGVTVIKLSTKEKKVTTSNILNDKLNELESITNEIIENNLQNEIQITIIDNNETQNIRENDNSNGDRKEEVGTTNENKKNNQEENNKNIISNINTSMPNKEVLSNNSENEETKEENITNSNTTTENVVKEENSNASLANTTYRTVNTAILPEIKSILEDEISKDKELVDFGTKVLTGNKTQCYSNTTGFTYMFVKEIEKGKVTGNYVKFPERVRNTVGAFGKYYIYAEDEFVYNSQGLNPKWSQTLVWIYITF